MSSFDQRFGDLRSLLQREPDAVGWGSLCLLLDAMEREDAGRTSAQALPYAAQATRSWPAALRVTPRAWLARAEAGDAPAALALCATLETGERTRIAREEAVRLAGCAQLGQIEALDWCVEEVSNGAHRALLAAPWIRRVRALTLRQTHPSRRQCAALLAACGPLERLSIRMQSAREDVQILRDAASLAALQHLHIAPVDSGWTDMDYWRDLADAPFMVGLKALDLRQLYMSAATIGALLERARERGALHELRALHLDGAELTALGQTALAALLRHPEALEALTLPSSRLSPEELARLMPPDGAWGALRELSLHSIFDHHGALTDWLGELALPSLRRLRIAQLENVSFQSFLDWMHAPWMPGLERLELERCALPQRAWRDPSVGQALGGLTSLNLAHTSLEDDGARGLARHQLPALRSIDLSGAIPAEALPQLARAPWWPQLTALHLRNMSGPEGTPDALLELELGPRVEALDLSWTPLEEEDLSRLMRGQALDRLRSLSLDGAQLTHGRGLLALLDRLPALQRLSIRQTQLADVAAVRAVCDERLICCSLRSQNGEL
jgi:hypothetical protein